MLNALIIAILSFMISLPSQMAPTMGNTITQTIEPVEKVEQKVAPQEVKSMTKPAIDQTAVEKLEASINMAKTGIEMSKRLMEGLSPERAAKSLTSIERQKVQLADLERQLAELTNP